MLESLVDMLFPPVCPLCEKEIAKGSLCAQCSRSFWEHRIKEPFCPVCGVPFPNSPGPGHKCGECLATPRPFVEARSACVYAPGVDAAVKAFKYGGRSMLAEALGGLLIESAATFSAKPDLIMPVPLHKRRLRGRGFNQSLLLARVLSNGLSVKLDYLSLRRVRHTAQQTGLKHDEREKNVAGAFSLSAGSAVSGSRVLLVDDVYTTGATIAECSKVLKKAGAEVYAITLARAGVS
ncbi:MAG TPA: ComF family protein [Thermodesulfobacteriota bacterium]|nr:ComF family protein [Thermodesulfobacteriota bacterium]